MDILAFNYGFISNAYGHVWLCKSRRIGTNVWGFHRAINIYYVNPLDKRLDMGLVRKKFLSRKYLARFPRVCAKLF